MSWFGETFGDSLNSLKGQITKITKEVLTEDESENGDPGSDKLNLKKLEELCAAKDLEINSLREENVKISEKFQEELKMLRNENKKFKTECKKADEGNSFLSDSQIREICELENQLQQIQLERDHLEELDKDHQSNICFVAQQRDNYKQELEKLKGTHSALQVKYEELLNSKDDEKGGNYLSDINLTENQVKPDELISLRESTEILQAQVESSQGEKGEMAKVIEKQEFNCENFKEKIEKLMEDMRILGEEKKTIESENEKLKQMINSITSDLNNKVDELKAEQELRNEDAEKLKELTQTLERVEFKQTDFQKCIDSQIRRLANIFFGHAFEDKYPEIPIPDLVTEIENFWKNISAEKEINDKIYAETLSKLESDILCLRSSKNDLERDMRLEMQREEEAENKYQEEINLLQARLSELKSSEQECLNKSQTDDVKRLSQEVSKLKGEIRSKDEQLRDCYAELRDINQELNCLRSMSVKAEHDLFRLSCENDGYEHSMMEVKAILDAKDEKINELTEKDTAYQERINYLETENRSLLQKNGSLRERTSEACYKANCLDSENNFLRKKVAKIPTLEKELEDIIESKSELEKICADMQNTISNRDKELEDLKAQCIIKESRISEQDVKIQDLTRELEKICADMQNTISNRDKELEDLKAQCIIKESRISEQDMKIQDLTRELNQSKEDNLKLEAVEEELKKCKEIVIEMEMQRQELSEESELINESDSLKFQVLNKQENDAEIERLTRENTDLKEVCSKLEIEIKNKKQNDALTLGNETVNYGNPEIISPLQSENYGLRSYIQEQTNIITNLTYENNELKHQLQLVDRNVNKLVAEMVQPKQDEYKINSQDTNSIPNIQGKRNSPQPPRRSNSDFRAGQDIDTGALRMELEKFQEISQRQIDEYKTLQEQFNIIVNREAYSKKELERLRLHLIEMENYYVETIDEYKAELSAAEEQLKNSSSFYTSNKVRDNQHLESLQSQIRLMSTQRDSLQEQLSTAQDEIQKQKAALVSLHVVLQQFQQDKERECESITVKYQNQLAVSDERLTELQQEKESLTSQLLDAKSGLKAASRLGEQLEKKNEYIVDLEGRVAKMEADVKDLEEAAKLMNQSDAEKVDKSLLKNLLLGYISSQKADRKEQILRIMMSVLDFDEEERNKTGIDNAQPGWLSSLLHPKRDGEGSSQSLSEAFIRFLENESRPRPQLKLLPDGTSNSDKSKSESAAPKPPRMLEELVLPTFNSPQSSESFILKDVLNNP